MVEIELPTTSAEKYRLNQLHRWLTYEISGLTIGGVGFFGPAAFVGGILAVAAILFTPYMLLRLLQVRRFGWVAGFFIWVGLSGLLGHLAGVGVILLPLAAFYIYTAALRYAVGKWVDDLREMRQIAHERYWRHREAAELEQIRIWAARIGPCDRLTGQNGAFVLSEENIFPRVEFSFPHSTKG